MEKIVNPKKPYTWSTDILNWVSLGLGFWFGLRINFLIQIIDFCFGFGLGLGPNRNPKPKFFLGLMSDGIYHKRSI